MNFSEIVPLPNPYISEMDDRARLFNTLTTEEDVRYLQSLYDKALESSGSSWFAFPEFISRAFVDQRIVYDRNFTNLPVSEWTKGEKMIRFVERECFVPDGKFMGKPMSLMHFQRAFIRATYDSSTHVNKAILSVARKNGKTGTIAPLALAHILGPFVSKNAQVVSGAMNRDQAAIVATAMSKMTNLNPNMKKRTKLFHDGKIVGISSGVTYKALAKDGAGAQGLSPIVGILDELGQIVGPRDSFVDAIVTAQGAHEHPLIFGISTQSASDGDFLSIWIDDAMRGEDKAAVCHLYAAEENADMLCKKQWLYSNPALGVFRSFKDLETNLVRASRMPSSEAGARNLLLNQRISLLTLAVSPAVWRANKAPINEELFFQYPVHIGLDLSARNDLTAAVLSVQNPEDNHVHVKPIVFTPLEHLAERVLSDRAPYDQWVKDEIMYALPGGHLDYSMIAETLAGMTKGMTIASVSFDRWRFDVFKPYADTHGFATDAEWIQVGQGFKDFGLRVDGLDTLLLQSRIHHGSHPLLNLGASNAIVVSDPTGARKYDKSKSSQRIDTLVAMAMSVYPLSDGKMIATDIDAMMF